VRSIARDLGHALGCLGHVVTLRRTWVGAFDLEHAVTLEKIEELAKTPEIDGLLHPVALGLSDLPELRTTQEGAAKLRERQPGSCASGRCRVRRPRLGLAGWAARSGWPISRGRIAPRAGFQPVSPIITHPQKTTGPAMITRSFQKGDAARCRLLRLRAVSLFADAGLGRTDRKGALFIMLNPSTATEVQNDPTVERCERRARALGFGAFRVLNIFAWRATDPRDMRAAADPVGPQK
jgi:hypothetical protein